MILTYNGVTLPDTHCVTSQYDEEVILAADGGYLRTRYTVAVEVVISRDVLLDGDATFDSAFAAATSPTEIMDILTIKLKEPGQPLILTDSGGVNELLRSPNSGQSIDDNRGPKPLRVSVTNFSEETFLVSFAIATELACKESGSTPTVLRNTWGIDLHFDQNWFLTQVVSGQLHLSTAAIVNANNKIAPIAEAVALIKAPPKGFVRGNWRFQVDPTGSVINYTFVDQQVKELPVWPAVNITGTYTETSDGITPQCSISLDLNGPPNVARGNLVATGVKIAVAFCSGGSYTIAESTYISGSVSISLFGNTNSARIDLRCHKTNFGKDEEEGRGTLSPFGVTGESIFSQITFGRTKALSPEDQDYALLQPVFTALSSAMCDTDSSVMTQDDDGIPLQRNSGSQPQLQVDVTERTQKVEPLTKRVQQQSSSRYTDYRIDTTYVKKLQKYLFPSTSAEADNAIIQVSNPVCFKIKRYQGEKVAGTPEKLKESTDTNDVLVYEDVTTSAPQFTKNMAAEVVAIAGTQVYAMKTCPTQVEFGRLPYTKTTVTVRATDFNGTYDETLDLQ